MLTIRLLSSRLKPLATIWLIAEVLIFVGVAYAIGLGWALLVGLATTLLGASLLKRAGAAAMMRLRDVLKGRDTRRPSDALDSMLAAVAAASLILPGFLSDTVGLFLAIPVVRRHVARWMRGRGLGVRFEGRNAGSNPQTIDVYPDVDRYSIRLSEHSGRDG